MNQPFDAIDFALYLRSRWRVAAGCCLVAVIAAGIAGTVLPKRYTATASLIIQPPASADPRAALAVSPVYLESLKTYQNYATSNTLFARALRDLGLRQRYPNTSLESLKRQVLAVSKPAATRIIDISVTLDDATMAKRLAQFIAEQTVVMNRSLDEHASDSAVRQAEANVAQAEERLRKAVNITFPESVEALMAEVNTGAELRYDMVRQLSQARTDLADLNSQRGLFPANDEKAVWNAREIAATSARIQDLETQQKAMEAITASKAALLERVRTARESLDAEQKLARADLETSRTKLSELRGSSAFRGERLEVLDPGIVPERPSWPNVPLIVLVALMTSLLGSLGYLAAAFGYNRALSRQAERVYHMR